MWLQHLRGSFYTLFFVLLNAVYLVIELSFNARVLDVSATMSPDMDYGQLEIYGRTIAAAGATLLAWRLLLPYDPQLRLHRLLLKFLVIAMLVFPLVFVGQKKLIDSLVDQSSAETRRSAEILTLLKYGIANGFVEIDELALDGLTLHTPEGKVFITLSGLLAYNSNPMRRVLEERLDRIAGYAIATQQSQQAERLYTHYRYARERVLNEFKRYQAAVNRLETQQAGAMDEAITLYEQAMNRAMLQWLQYSKALLSAPTEQGIPRVKLSLISTLLQVSMARLNECVASACTESAQQQLEVRLARHLGFFSPMSNWCSQRDNDSAVFDCVTDQEQIRQQLVHTRRVTLAQQAGLTRPYASKLAYLTSADLRSTVIASLAEAGIVTDPNWRFDRYPDMLVNIAEQLRQRYRGEYDAELNRQLGLTLEPRTPVTDFNQLSAMQGFYQAELTAASNTPIELDLDRQQFERQHLAPLYLAKFTMLLNKLKAGEEWYQSDAPYEESGKNSLRNLVIPPVVIAFSLVFGLLNLINLLLSLVFLLIEEKLLLRWVGFAVLSLLVMLLPLQQSYRIYSQPAYQELIEETQANYGLWVHGLNWVAETEPLIYPLGNMMRYNLLDGFEFN